MKHKIELTMMIALSLWMTGCSLAEPEAIAKGNWYQIGYRDGLAGHHQRTYKSLSSLDVNQQSRYDQGYADGVTIFCNPDFAYQIGLSGQYYDGICDGTPNGNRFRLEWKRGWEQSSQ